MAAYTWFLTGASRGIGLETTRQLLQSASNTVFATCRSPATALDLSALASSAGKLHIVQLDVADETSIKKGTAEVLKILDGGPLDYVINNAAINRGADLAFNFSPTDLSDTITSNVIGPALVSRYLLPAIEKSSRKVIVNMTSGLASIGKNLGPKSTSYSISKTAVNMLTYKQARERPDLIPFVIDPGWVKTKMGGAGAILEPHQSVTGILKVITSATPTNAGKFYGYMGNEIPW
ncbi:NAD(P)-binding protein [Leucogyrophana mollusca]|uniref:NAD(P)-binding protein n=1 Tax=Leucogyrophana mollusca TaxID=85980 RepID=A0ACB8BQ90_9AGAM|nr:NAD(P)-binding protein [Leucogyrophana mollusca]